MHHRKRLIYDTILLGVWTVVSRLLGFVRNVLQARYLGVGIESDAFVVAFRLPNMLRKIFAEGALNAAVTPTLVTVLRREGMEPASEVVTGTLLAIELVLTMICTLVVCYAPAIISFFAPGFTVAQQQAAVPLARILIFFIMAASAIALCASALYAVHKPRMAALSQPLMNLLFIIGLGIVLFVRASSVCLAVFFVCAGVAVAVAHAIAYYRAGYRFIFPGRETRTHLMVIVKKFVPALISMSPFEIIALIDGQFASYLSMGSVTAISYANDFMRIPLGILVVALSTLMIPHLTRVATYAPRRIGYYLFAAIELMWWMTVPVGLLMGWYAPDIFKTLFVSEKLSVDYAVYIGTLLRASLCGLPFFAVNKLLVSCYYALHNTTAPACISGVGILINVVGNMLLMPRYGAVGLLMATALSGVVQTILLIIGLHLLYRTTWYTGRFVRFVGASLVQLVLLGALGLATTTVLGMFIQRTAWSFFLTAQWGMWLWIAPVWFVVAGIGFMTRAQFGLQLALIDRVTTTRLDTYNVQHMADQKD